MVSAHAVAVPVTATSDIVTGKMTDNITYRRELHILVTRATLNWFTPSDASLRFEEKIEFSFIMSGNDPLQKILPQTPTN